MAGTRGVALALLAALALAACGEKPEPDLSKIPPPRSSPDSPAELIIIARGDREAIRYEISRFGALDRPLDRARITLRNEASEPTTGRMVRTDRELSPAELTAQLDRLPALGPPRSEPGKTSAVDGELKPGTYYVVGDQPVSDRPASFRVR